MKITRRHALHSTLFGAGYIGLRALATGLPVSFLMNPRRALADPTACVPSGKPQYVIFATSGQGDPINANVPGTYIDGGVSHSQDPAMAPTPMTIGGQSYTAAAPWATLPANVLARTAFWHIMTNTPVHPKEPDVLSLMGSTATNEMLPSLLAKQLQPMLCTIQSQPITVGATTPSEGLTFNGAAQPIIPPTSLKATLSNPTGPLTTLQPLRDATLQSLHDLYKNTASPAQRTYLDSLITSQTQVRSIKQNLLEAISAIKDNSVASQITSAIALIQMNVTPVIAIHIPFGGDNHSDPALTNETAQHVTGVASIVSLFSQLDAAGLTDQVSFMTLNVFGRTLGSMSTDGRQHNPNHQVSITIGKPFKSIVIGGIKAASGDYVAVPFDSKTGSTSGSDVTPGDSLASFGKTMLTAVGGDATAVSAAVTAGVVVTGALTTS